jgi:hypothetical protein
MSEIKTNKIKPALNPTKVTLKTGLSVVDPAAPSNGNKSFEVNFKGQIEINTPLLVGNLAGSTAGVPGQVLLSRGNKLSPMWGPIPSANCPPVADTGSIWAYESYSSDTLIIPGCDVGQTLFPSDALVQLTDSLSYPTQFKVLGGNQVSGGSAISIAGELYIWGVKNSGRIGNTYKSNLFAPRERQGCPYKVGSLNNWNSVYSTNHFTIATKNDGTMWVWGSNHSAIYGNGTLTPYSVVGSTLYYLTSYPGGISTILANEPIRLGTETTWKQVFNYDRNDVNQVVYAQKNDGTIWSWGTNVPTGFQTVVLGYVPTDGSGRGQYTPKQIVISGGVNNDWVNVGGGNWIGWGTKTDGSLWMWGYKGRLAVGSFRNTTDGQTKQFTPIKISGPGYAAFGSVCGTAKWKKVCMVYDCAYALQQDGSVWVWGQNQNGQYLGLGTTNPLTGQPWGASPNGDSINVWVNQPVKLDNNKYIDICLLGDTAAALVRADGSLWLIGTFTTTTSFNDKIGTFYTPYQPKWSTSIIWSKIVSSATGLGIIGIGTEKIVAPSGTTARWFRRGYTSLSSSPCSSSGVGISTDPIPSAPSGWVYCDGTNGTVNMKSWVNPVTGKLDWPPADNANGCGDSSGNLSGQITYIQKT